MGFHQIKLININYSVWYCSFQPKSVNYSFDYLFDVLNINLVVMYILYFSVFKFDSNSGQKFVFAITG